MPLRLLINYGRPGDLKNEQDRPRGGIQTALLGLSTALARRGHDVHVFAPCLRPGLHEGVFFHDRKEFARFTQVSAVDVQVVIPKALPLLMPLRARARVVCRGGAPGRASSRLVSQQFQKPSVGVRILDHLG